MLFSLFIHYISVESIDFFKKQYLDFDKMHLL